MRSMKTGHILSVTAQEKVKTESFVFEDLIADFVIENRREPDTDEMAWLARSIRRAINMGEFYAA